MNIINSFLVTNRVLRMKRRKKYALLPLIIILLLVSGCSPAPSKSEVNDVIVTYFETKHYRVVELGISHINPIPLSKQKYMGTPAYTIDVPTIILEMTEDTGAPWNYIKGQKISFKNAQISIRQSTGQNKKWLIANISGVSVP